MKKIRKMLQDYRETGEAETEVTISYWHIIALIAVVVLFILTCNR